MAKKNMRRALISSIVAIVLCFAMLVGTTYAWFTDTAAAGVNTLKSGKLDMVLEYTTDFTTWTEVTPETKLFPENALFEPGYALVAYVRVKNNGNLWFKYKLDAKVAGEEAGINQAGEEFNLSSYLKFGSAQVNAKYDDRDAAIAAVDANATLISNATLSFNDIPLAPEATSDPIALVIYMPTTVGNEANYGAKQPVINFGVVALATQYTEEEDSFSKWYDNGATYPLYEFAGLKSLNVPGNTINAKNSTTGPLENKPIDKALELYATSDPATVPAEVKNYICDFVISFNQDVEADKVSVYGQYDAFSEDWFGGKLSAADSVPATLKKDVGVKLIEDWLSAAISGVEVNYNDVLTSVKDFKCALHVQDPADGLVATVKLVMTDPDTGNEYIISTLTQSY